MDLLYVIAGAVLIFLLGMACDRLVERIRRTKREIEAIKRWPKVCKAHGRTQCYDCFNAEFGWAKNSKNKLDWRYAESGWVFGHPLSDADIKSEAFKEYQEHHPEHDPGLKK